jgi:hypothetical protein
MLRHKVVAAAALAVSLILAAGCATTGGGNPGPLTDSVSLVLLSEKEVKDQFGWNFTTNPFMARVGSLIPGTYDYVVAQLNLSTDAGAKVELLQAEVVDKDNTVKAWYYDRKDFADFAASLGQSQDENSMARRRNVVNWYYLPSRSMDLKHGSYKYIMVFMGKHPVPDNLVAHVLISVNDQVHEFKLPVPNASN